MEIKRSKKMKDLDKKIIVFSTIGLLFLLGYFGISIIEVIEESIIRLDDKND